MHNYKLIKWLLIILRPVAISNYHVVNLVAPWSKKTINPWRHLQKNVNLDRSSDRENTVCVIISIRVIDAVVNIFSGVFCNCVLVYLYIVALVCIQCGCSSTGFLFALTTFYIVVNHFAKFDISYQKQIFQI